MESHVVVISREMVKPCSDTPNHLKKLKLSYLDQLARPQHFPLLFFIQIQSNQSKARILDDLKHSLSHTLPSFYPLAGRFEDNSLVDCNDEGVDFIEARAPSRLADAIQDPEMDHLKHFLPIDFTTKSGALLLVQVTFFECGGVAVGICFSHRIADCTSIMAFINSWAAACRGECDKISSFCLSFDLAAYFPTRELPTDRFTESPSTDGEFTTKRFVFDKERLARLKRDAAGVNDPTRVEAVTAFIWRSFLKAAEMKSPNMRRESAALHIVNLRQREKALEGCFGNCWVSSSALSSTGDGVEELGDLAGKVKESIKRMGGGECTSGDAYWDYHKRVFGGFGRGEAERCSFSSWCRFLVYEVDFGWGKPVWWCAPALPLKNLTILVATRCGEGIEAWINTDEGSFQMLRNEIQLHFDS